LLVETSLLAGDGPAIFYTAKPFIVRQPSETGDFRDLPPGPRIKWGKSFARSVHVLIEDTATG
jgi:hypothetical protein